MLSLITFDSPKFGLHGFAALFYLQKIKKQDNKRMFELYQKIIHLQFLGYKNPLITAVQMMPNYKYVQPVESAVIDPKKKREYNQRYYQKHHIDSGPKGTEILCLETQEVFESVSKAGEILNCNPSLIFRAMQQNNGYYKKMHFVRLEGRTVEEVLADAKAHPEAYRSKTGKWNKYRNRRTEKEN